MFRFQPNLIVHGGVIAATLLCVGCARQTGVMPLGPDTYRLQVARAPILGGDMAAQQEALTEAQSYCAKQSKQFVVIGTDQPKNTRFEVDFRCLNSGDPDLVRPTLAPVPDVVIQDRRGR